MTRTADPWNVLLGIAVIALTGICSLTWLESRRLADRLGRLEADNNAGTPAAGPGSSPGPGPEVTALDAIVDVRDAAFKGNPAATLAVVEFSDFECPYCARYFKDTFGLLQQRYVATGKVKYFFRHLPLEEIHPSAFLAAEVAECGRRQGLFWELHDHFFRNQKTLRDADIRQTAISLGAEPARLDECLRVAASDRVLRDMNDARHLGAAGTPLFFIGRTAVNGRVEASHTINGARPFEVFEALLESLLGSQ